jgi:FAD:protein FMN transferase
VLVTDDSRAVDAHGQVVALREGGLATSSTTVRRWRAGQVEAHHIVDPRTGAPAEECWRTVSVAAPSCVRANTAATAAVVLGSHAPRWLAGQGLTARLVRPNGTVETIGAWPAEAVAGNNAPMHAGSRS